MLYVIGDIHGCFEKLLKIMTYIGDDSKIIFLGDYIDRGPKSKEVVDFVQNLKNSVLLIGNHEDMLIKYVEGVSNAWLYPNNGGKDTIRSFGSLEKIIEYLEFFKTLKLLHIENIDNINILFSHGNINPNFPVYDVLKIKTYEEYYEVIQGKINSIMETNIWERMYFDKPSGNYVVIHGHTPFEDVFINSFSKGIFEINIDTGAVYGGALTALKIPNTSEEIKIDPMIYKISYKDELKIAPLCSLKELYKEE